jgi:hypothetical protein
MQLRLCGVDTSRNSIGLYCSETSKANDKVIEVKRSEAKRSESFDNVVFFKRTRSTVGKFILKRNEAVYIIELKNRSEAKLVYIKL